MYTNWTEYVPTKLASQFVLVNFGKLKIPKKAQATIVTSDFVRLVSSDPQYLERYYNTSNFKRRKYHQVIVLTLFLSVPDLGGGKFLKVV